MKGLFSLFTLILLTIPFFLSCEEEEQIVPVSSVSLSQPSAEMIVGESITLRATISPSNATRKEIIWASSKKSVASVDQSGKVVAIAAGATTITALAGGKLGSCYVTVSNKNVAVSSITLDKTSASMKVGETLTLIATVKPDDATAKTVIWSTSDATVAEIYDGVVTAKKIGTATIKAKAGNKEATCSITVTAEPSDQADLVIGISNLSTTGAKLSVTTTSTKTYFWMYHEKEEWDQYGGDVIWDSYISYLEGEGILDQWIVTGNDTLNLENELKANTKYIIFAAYCDKKGVRSSDFYTKTFKTTETTEPSDQEDLNIGISDITTTGAKISVTTTSTKSYFWMYHEKGEWDQYGGDVIWDSYISYLEGKGELDQYIVTGNDILNVEDKLEANTEYIVFAAYCDKKGVRSSNFYTKTFKTTETTEPSNQEDLNIGISDITTTGAKISVTTTSTKSYFWMYHEKGEWDQYGGDVIWDSYISYLEGKGELDQYIVTGNDILNVEDKLEANTEYIVFAAYCDKKGVRSSNFYTKTFKTTETTEPSDQEDLNIGISDITITGAKLSVTTMSTKSYFWMYCAKSIWDRYGGNAVWEIMISNLEGQGKLDQWIVTGNKTLNLEYELEAGTEYIVFAAYCDEKGVRSSDLYTKTFTTLHETYITIKSENITQTTADVIAEIIAEEEITVSERGFKYYDPIDKEWKTTKVSDSSSLYMMKLMNLTPYKTYQVKAYAILTRNTTSEQQELESDTISFITQQAPAKINMIEVRNVSCTSALVYGWLVYYGGSRNNQTQYRSGFILSNTPNPTIYTPDVVIYGFSGLFEGEKFGKAVENLNPNTQYYVRSFYINDVSESYSEQISFKTYPVPEDAVDLGLPSGVLWCNHNLGGNKPEDFGGYYSWGDTKEKNSYLISTTPAYSKTSSYVGNIIPRVLLPQYDAAQAIMGGGWRMPTETEFRELYLKCEKSYVKREDDYGREVAGILFTGPNGNSIFLPASGHKESNEWIPLYTFYWCSEVPYDTSYFAYCAQFELTSVVSFVYLQVYYGAPIRPVL